MQVWSETLWATVRKEKFVFAEIMTHFAMKMVVIDGEMRNCRSHISFTLGVVKELKRERDKCDRAR